MTRIALFAPREDFLCQFDEGFSGSGVFELVDLLDGFGAVLLGEEHSVFDPVALKEEK